MFTSPQAAEIGVSPHQLSRLVKAGAIERLAQGVYRMAGSPAGEHEGVQVAWMALRGYLRSPEGVPGVVAAGPTAAELHGLGDFYLDEYDFVVPRRRGTRLDGVRLRVRQLARSEVSYVDGLPVMTVERVIADLVEMNVDHSLAGDVIADADRAGKIASARKLAAHLEPMARRNHQPSGEKLRKSLYEIAGIAP